MFFPYSYLNADVISQWHYLFHGVFHFSSTHLIILPHILTVSGWIVAINLCFYQLSIYSCRFMNSTLVFIMDCNEFYRLRKWQIFPFFRNLEGRKFYHFLLILKGPVGTMVYRPRPYAFQVQVFERKRWRLYLCFHIILIYSQSFTSFPLWFVTTVALLGQL